MSSEVVLVEGWRVMVSEWVTAGDENTKIIYTKSETRRCQQVGGEGVVSVVGEKDS